MSEVQQGPLGAFLASPLEMIWESRPAFLGHHFWGPYPGSLSTQTRVVPPPPHTHTMDALPRRAVGFHRSQQLLASERLGVF